MIKLNGIMPVKSPEDAARKLKLSEDRLSELGYETVEPIDVAALKELLHSRHITGLMFKIEILNEDTNISTEVEDQIEHLKHVIKLVTGLDFSQYSVNRSREQMNVYARRIFAYHCNRMNVSERKVSLWLRRDRTSITQYRTQLDTFLAYDFKYREVFNQVKEEFEKQLIISE